MKDRLRVLYVDDEPSLLGIGKLFLEKEGAFTVDTSTSAIVALEILKTEKYDAIISDYQMPGMDGITFLKRLKASGNTTPFIIFTGRGREEVVIEALNEGADFYIQKGGEPKSQFAELSNKIQYAVIRKQVEEDIKRSKTQLTAIIQSSPIPKFVIDKDHRVIHWNKALEVFSGISEKEVIGTTKHWRAFYREERPCMADLLLDGAVEQISRFYPGKYAKSKLIDGAYEATDFFPHMGDAGAWLFFIASVIKDDEGNILGAVETLEDLTETYRKTEEAEVANQQIQTVLDQAKRSEERYRNIVEDQTEFISRFLPDGTHVFVNEAYCRYFGKSRDDIIGYIFRPDIPEDDRIRLKEHFMRLSPEHPVATVDHRIIMPDGRVCWQRWSDRVIFDEPGAVLEYQSVGRDITEVKRAEIELNHSHEELSGAYEQIAAVEEELRSNYNELAENQDRLQKSEKSFQTLVENIPGIVYRVFVKEGYRMHFFNQMLGQLTGYSAADLTHGEVCSLDPFIHIDDRSRVIETVEDAIRLRAPFEVEYRMIVKDGSIRHFMERGRPVFDSERDLEYIDGIINDINERKQTEKSLAESEAKFRSIFENMQDAFYRTDLEGNLILFSPGGARQAGYESVDEIIGVNIADVIYFEPGQRSDFLAALEKNGKVENYPLVVKTRDGSLHNLVANSHFYYDDAGNVLGVEGILHDITDITSAEMAIRESDARFRILVEASTDVIWEVDLNGNFTYISPQCIDLIGYTPADLIGKPIYNLVPAEYHGNIGELYRTYIREKRAPRSIMLPAKHRDGHRIDLEIRSVILFDNLGEVRGFGGIALDITERNRMQESVRESENRYRNIVEDQTEFISRFLPDGTHVFVNEAYCRCFGKDRDEIIGHTFVPDIPEEDKTIVRQHFQSLTPKNPVATVAHRIIMPDGSIHWHRWSDRAIFNEAGSVVEYQSVGRDITEQKQVEEALRNSEQILAGIIEHLPDPTLVVNVNGEVIAWNRALEALTGTKASDMLGKGNYEYAIPLYGERRPLLIDLALNPDDEVLKTYSVVKREGETLVGETLFAQPLGKKAVLWGKASPLYDKAGNVMGAVESIRDITERKSEEEKFRLVNKQLNLLTGITRHDINNQLTVLKGYLELSSMHLDDPEYQKKFITLEMKAATTIEEQIAFTREFQDMGAKPPQWQSLPEVVEQAKNHLLSGNVNIETENIDQEILADSLFGKVIYNLVDNALKYGGDTMTKIRFFSFTSNGNLVVVSQDDGKGIPKKDKSRIFDQGFGNHTGLGLYLSREILSLTGITITETGEPGKGARFEMTVPKGMYR